MHISLPKWQINQFKPVQQSRQQKPRAYYYPNICTVVISLYRADVFMTKEKGKEGAIEDYFGKV